MTLSREDAMKLQNYLTELNGKTRTTQKTTEVVSVFGYLIGVRKSVFDNPNEPLQNECYDRLNREKPARIIRNLCILRNQIEHNFGKINDSLRNQHRSITSLTEYIPMNSLMELENDGVTVFKKSNTKLGMHIIELNRLIGDRINNCKEYFPTWLNWDYVKDLFIMPDSLTEAGIKAEANEFFTHLERYPYGVYMSWAPADCGNVLSSDKKFVSLLYEWNSDQFRQWNKVEDAGDYVTGNIYDFISAGNKVVFFVDCENSDPYNLCAALEGLDREYIGKVEKVILFNDIHTSSAWELLAEHISVPVEHILIERVKENKSLVDIRLAMRVSEEFYKDNVDSFVIVSSDSDYWGVITGLPDANYLVMVEHGKCGPDMRDALDESGIFFCYIDEFHSARSEGIKTASLYRELDRYMAEHLQFNFRSMLNAALAATRIDMTDAEKRQFFDKHIRSFQASMDKDGQLQISLKK